MEYNKIPSAFTYLLSHDHYWEFTFVIKGISREDNTAKLNLEIEITSADEDLQHIPRKWEIKVAGFKECKIDLIKDDGEIEILTDHPLLWKYNDVQSGLYFYGTCSDPYNLLLELYQVNEKLYEGYHNFTDIKRLDRLLLQPGGLIANGPKQLLEQYAALLEKYDLKPSIIGDRTLTEWNGAEHVPASRENKICWIGGNFIIGESFEFVPVEPEDIGK